MKSSRDGIVCGVNFDTLTSTDGIQIVEVEEGVLPLEEGLALHELALDALCVAAGGEGLAMAVFLLAWRARGRTGGAAGMLGVALAEGRRSKGGRMLADSRGSDGGFAVGRHRRDLP